MKMREHEFVAREGITSLQRSTDLMVNGAECKIACALLVFQLYLLRIELLTFPLSFLLLYSSQR